MTSLLPQILGPVGCLVVVLIVAYMFQAGKWHSDQEFRAVQKERDFYREALQTERKAVDEYAQTGSITNQLIAALTQVATSKQRGGQLGASGNSGQE